MGFRYKNCPPEPRETCPFIDKVIELCNKSEDLDSDVFRILEVIRAANADLRKRACFYEERAEYYESELDDAKSEIEKLREESGNG